MDCVVNLLNIKVHECFGIHLAAHDGIFGGHPDEGFPYFSLLPGGMDLMRVINTFLLWCALIFLVCGVLLEWFSFWVAAGIFLAGCLIRLAVGKMLE